MEALGTEEPLETELGALGAKYLVEFGDRIGIVDARSSANGRRRHLRLYLEDLPMHRMLDVPAKRRVGDVVAAMAGLPPTRVFRLPPGKVVGRDLPAMKRSGWALIVPGFVVLVLALALPLDPWVRFGLLALGLAAMLAAFTVGARKPRARHWAFVTRGRRSSIGELRPPAQPPEAHVAEVDALKGQYGALLSDVVYRIKHPALFDPHEPHTKEFTLALLEWDDTHERLDDDAQRTLATRVLGTFRAARANAEHVGMDHLPAEARDDARTALKAATVAVDERAPEPERAAALSRMVRILESLALYYLPTGLEAREAIHGREIRQLPGRSHP